MEHPLYWEGDVGLKVDGTTFELAPFARTAADSSGGALLLRKPRWMVEEYEALRAECGTGRNLFELGIYQGASMALFALLFDPRRFVAIELTTGPKPALEQFIADRQLEDRVHPFYGVDQADRDRLERLVDDEFGAEELDLVIDDASHLLAQTTASFNVLFPRVRPGGLYVIEDWSWHHEHERFGEMLAARLAANDEERQRFQEMLAARLAANAEEQERFGEMLAGRLAANDEDRERFQEMLAARLAANQSDSKRFRESLAKSAGDKGAVRHYSEALAANGDTLATSPESRTDSASYPPPDDTTALPDQPLSRLIAQLLLAMAYDDTLIPDARLRRGFSVFRRGPAEIDPATFDIRDRSGTLGRSVLS